MKGWLDLAHHYWTTLGLERQVVIDATCGNGHDTLFLAKLKPHALYSIDIQAKALSNAKQLLSEHLTAEECLPIKFVEGNHIQFPKEILAKSVKLIVYNLGYLPGGDKSITTLTDSTLHSLKAALELVTPEGAISVTCYPGHSEGKREEEMILRFAKELDPKKWCCCYHHWVNRTNAPSLLMINHL